MIANPSQFFGMSTSYVPILGTTPIEYVTLQAAPGSAPHGWNIDFSPVKDTTVTQSRSIHLRPEFFNLFNLHFRDARSDPGGSTFGLSTCTQTAERQIQLGARCVF